MIDARSGGGVLIGGDGQDQILGGAYGIQAFGGNGADWIIGGAGDDYIEGGSGRDLLAGGAGRDVFHFAAGDGADLIADFDLARDRLSFGFDDATVRKAQVSAQGDDTLLSVGGVEVLFEGISARGFDLGDLVI